MSLRGLRMATLALLLYGGPALAGALGSPAWITAAFAAIFLTYMVLSGTDAARPDAWTGIALLAAVQIALVLLMFYGGRNVADPQPGTGPLWPLLLSAAALPFAWQQRKTAEMNAFLDSATRRLNTIASDLETLPPPPPEGQQQSQDRAVLAWEIERAETGLAGMPPEDRDRLVRTLADLVIEAEVLTALTARADDPDWRRLRQDYLGHPEVTGYYFSPPDLIDALTADLALPGFRNPAATLALRWSRDLDWSNQDRARVLGAARAGPPSPQIAVLIAELERYDAR